jgi:hypothetical protein
MPCHAARLLAAFDIGHAHETGHDAQVRTSARKAKYWECAPWPARARKRRLASGERTRAILSMTLNAHDDRISRFPASPEFRTPSPTCRVRRPSTNSGWQCPARFLRAYPSGPPERWNICLPRAAKISGGVSAGRARDARAILVKVVVHPLSIGRKTRRPSRPRSALRGPRRARRARIRAGRVRRTNTPARRRR